VLLGIYLFHDRLETAGWRLPVEVGAAVVLVVGVFLLSTSPLVVGTKDDSGGSGLLTRQAGRVHSGAGSSS
ncbi:MAG TPA: hypothetical protein VMB82_14140, partial [Acidimicrobiales bacterium]|nr:hypothetical protein [Acidimicrobiales bacterium]